MRKIFGDKQKAIRVKGKEGFVVREFEVGTHFMYNGQEYCVDEKNTTGTEIVCSPVSRRRFKIEEFDKILPL